MDTASDRATTASLMTFKMMCWWFRYWLPGTERTFMTNVVAAGPPSHAL